MQRKHPRNKKPRYEKYSDKFRISIQRTGIPYTPLEINRQVKNISIAFSQLDLEWSVMCKLEYNVGLEKIRRITTTLLKLSALR